MVAPAGDLHSLLGFPGLRVGGDEAIAVLRLFDHRVGGPGLRNASAVRAATWHRGIFKALRAVVGVNRCTIK